MNTTPRRKPTVSRPYTYSNDNWTSAGVLQLREQLARQTTPPENAAGIVIGSGGLPYLLGHVSLSTLFIADLHGSVINETKRRVTLLAEYTDWNDYDDHVYSPLDTTARYSLTQERRRAENAGLVGEYPTTRQRASMMDIIGVEGDLIDTAPLIAEQLSARREVVTFINFTNAAAYLAPVRTPESGVLIGEQVLAEYVVGGATGIERCYHSRQHFGFPHSANL